MEDSINRSFYYYYIMLIDLVVEQNKKRNTQNTEFGVIGRN